MDNIQRIDNIIDELKKKIGAIDQAELEEVSLTEEQLEIKSFLDERRIKYLIHFTDAENISSIKEHGILSIEQIAKLLTDEIISSEPKVNDLDRYDNELNYISLSVSGMNQFLYKVFRYGKQTIEHGVAIVIDASMLYKEIDTPRIYCNTNAANSEVIKGTDIESFKLLFEEVVDYGMRHFERDAEKRCSFEPTDIQAEILWNKCVPTKYIVCYWDLEEDFFYGN